MPTGKRASMREGPLAALFRKTADEAEGGEGAPSGAPSDCRVRHDQLVLRDEDVVEVDAEEQDVAKRAINLDVPFYID